MIYLHDGRNSVAVVTVKPGRDENRSAQSSPQSSLVETSAKAAAPA
jgi:hypothetical protein